MQYYSTITVRLRAHEPAACRVRVHFDDARRARDRRVEQAATLRLVELGEAASGIVYASDAAGSPRVEVVAPLPLPGGATVRYRISVTAGAGPEAAAFVAFALGPAKAPALPA